MPRIAPRHVFLIYAGHGAGGEEYNLDYYASRPDPESRSGRSRRHSHTGGYQARPHEYEQRVIGFLDHALLGTELREEPTRLGE